MNYKKVNLIVKSLLKSRQDNSYISNDNIELVPDDEVEAYLIQNTIHKELNKISAISSTCIREKK